jgi:hypothetical protein
MVANDVSVLDKLSGSAPRDSESPKNLYGHDAVAAFRVGRPSMDVTRRITTYLPGLATANTDSFPVEMT